MDKYDFKAITTELVCPWISSTKSNMSQVLAVTSHPTTNELLVLDCHFKVSCFKLQNGNPIVKPLEKLCIDSSLHHNKVSLFFTFGLFLGLVWHSGVISIHDIYSGAQFSTLDDLQGQNVHIWRCFHLVNSVGFWSISGIWKLQSGTVLETSECIRSLLQSANCEAERTDGSVVQEELSEVYPQTCALKRSCFFADDMSMELRNPSEHFVFPEFVTDSETNAKPCKANEQSIHAKRSMFTGPLCAANHLIKWNVSHRAAKLALDAVVCSQMLSDCNSTDEEVPEVFLDFLVGKWAQSPALALALLWEHPVHREFVLHKLEQYLSESYDKSQAQKTCLNELLHPYISEFLLLSKQIKSAIESSVEDMNQSPSAPTNCSEQEVASLLEAFNVGLLDVTSEERLSTLSQQQPQKVLKCVAEYLRIETQQEDLRDSPWGQRWRKIYRLVMMMVMMINTE